MFEPPGPPRHGLLCRYAIDDDRIPAGEPRGNSSDNIAVMLKAYHDIGLGFPEKAAQRDQHLHHAANGPRPLARAKENVGVMIECSCPAEQKGMMHVVAGGSKAAAED